jgi:hypothetical protein
VFLHITHAYHLTWADLYYILASTLSPDEHNRIWPSAWERANELHGQNPGLHLEADNVIPSAEPDWTYQPGGAGTIRINHMISCLLKGMKNNAHTRLTMTK